MTFQLYLSYLPLLLREGYLPNICRFVQYIYLVQNFISVQVGEAYLVYLFNYTGKQVLFMSLWPWKRIRRISFIRLCSSFDLVTDGIISLRLIKTETCLSLCVKASCSVGTQIHESVRKLKICEYSSLWQTMEVSISG